MSDGWLTPFDGDGIEWHETLPWKYTYQESDFGKLVSAVHAYEVRSLQLAERLAESERVRRQLAEALREISNAPITGAPEIPHDEWVRVVGVVRHALAASDALDKEEA